MSPHFCPLLWSHSGRTPEIFELELGTNGRDSHSNVSAFERLWMETTSVNLFSAGYSRLFLQMAQNGCFACSSQRRS